MKNIFLLPTDKPSHLMLRLERLYYFSTNTSTPTKGKNQHIFIISDEEIKKGDWCLLDHNVGQSTGFSILKCLEVDIPNGEYTFNDGDLFTTGRCKKIILTTDQDLIKDGIQSIPNEFLLWYVKNPSCEEVKGYYVPKNLFRDEDGWEYEITIPQEETNDGTIIQFLNGSHSYDGVWFGDKHPYREGYFWWRTILNEYQSERMYSEEEVLELLIKINLWPYNLDSRKDIKQWFEQFKK